MKRVVTGLLIGLVIGLGPAAADERDAAGSDIDLVTARTGDVIRSGLAYLAANQAADGSFGATNKTNKYKVAVTSFAGLAFLAGGSVPGRGRYGAQIERALRFILESVQKSGYITGADDQSRMHGHGLAALFLAEIYGMTRGAQRDEIRDAIQRALRCMAKSQTADGGWGYEPADPNHEGSITVVMLQAMRASRDVGFKVSKPTIHKAIGYLIRSANDNGSFKYRLNGGSNHETLPLTAAALSTMNAFGVYGNPGESTILGRDFKTLPGIMRKGMEFMLKYLGNSPPVDRYYQSFYYYTQFYAAQAFYKSKYGGRSLWRQWFVQSRDQLIDRFDSDQGCWSHSRYGKAYATAIAVLVLQIPYKYLPTFQR